MSEMIIIQGSQIQEITKHGFHYLNDIGNDVFVDFATCYLNDLRAGFANFKQLNPTSNMTLETYANDFLRNQKALGSRNTLGDSLSYRPYQGRGKPYMLFHTTPYTVIEYSSKDKLWKVMNFLWDNGWHLSDET